MSKLSNSQVTHKKDNKPGWIISKNKQAFQRAPPYGKQSRQRICHEKFYGAFLSGEPIHAVCETNKETIKPAMIWWYAMKNVQPIPRNRNNDSTPPNIILMK